MAAVDERTVSIAALRRRLDAFCTAVRGQYIFELRKRPQYLNPQLCWPARRIPRSAADDVAAMLRTAAQREEWRKVVRTVNRLTGVAARRAQVNERAYKRLEERTAAVLNDLNAAVDARILTMQTDALTSEELAALRALPTTARIMSRLRRLGYDVEKLRDVVPAI